MQMLDENERKGRRSRTREGGFYPIAADLGLTLIWRVVFAGSRLSKVNCKACRNCPPSVATHLFHLSSFRFKHSSSKQNEAEHNCGARAEQTDRMRPYESGFFSCGVSSKIIAYLNFTARG